VLTLERQRDQLSERLTRLTHETDPQVVEGFIYVTFGKARRVRGRLCCSILRRIDAINAEICRAIYPTFAVRPSEGFSDRVMRDIGEVAR
jgi:hypothetical protein